MKVAVAEIRCEGSNEGGNEDTEEKGGVLVMRVKKRKNKAMSEASPNS